jgi:hypothetical protein
LANRDMVYRRVAEVGNCIPRYQERGINRNTAAYVIDSGSPSKSTAMDKGYTPAPTAENDVGEQCHWLQQKLNRGKGGRSSRTVPTANKEPPPCAGEKNMLFAALSSLKL